MTSQELPLSDPGLSDDDEDVVDAALITPQGILSGYAALYRDETGIPAKARFYAREDTKILACPNWILEGGDLARLRY